MIHEIVFYKWLTIALKQQKTITEALSFNHNCDVSPLQAILVDKKSIEMTTHLHGFAHAIMCDGVALKDVACDREILALLKGLKQHTGSAHSGSQQFNGDERNLLALAARLKTSTMTEWMPDLLALGVSQSLSQLRGQHRLMLERVGQACGPFSPFDIVTKPSNERYSVTGSDEGRQ
jgi:hypothetical protein